MKHRNVIVMSTVYYCVKDVDRRASWCCHERLISGNRRRLGTISNHAASSPWESALCTTDSWVILRGWVGGLQKCLVWKPWRTFPVDSFLLLIGMLSTERSLQPQNDPHTQTWIVLQDSSKIQQGRIIELCFINSGHSHTGHGSALSGEKLRVSQTTALWLTGHCVFVETNAGLYRPLSKQFDLVQFSLSPPPLFSWWRNVMEEEA